MKTQSTVPLLRLNPCCSSLWSCSPTDCILSHIVELVTITNVENIWRGLPSAPFHSNCSVLHIYLSSCWMRLVWILASLLRAAGFHFPVALLSHGGLFLRLREFPWHILPVLHSAQMPYCFSMARVTTSWMGALQSTVVVKYSVYYGLAHFSSKVKQWLKVGGHLLQVELFVWWNWSSFYFSRRLFFCNFPLFLKELITSVVLVQHIHFFSCFFPQFASNSLFLLRISAHRLLYSARDGGFSVPEVLVW